MAEKKMVVEITFGSTDEDCALVMYAKVDGERVCVYEERGSVFELLGRANVALGAVAHSKYGQE